MLALRFRTWHDAQTPAARTGFQEARKLMQNARLSAVRVYSPLRSAVWFKVHEAGRVGTSDTWGDVRHTFLPVLSQHRYASNFFFML